MTTLMMMIAYTAVVGTLFLAPGISSEAPTSSPNGVSQPASLKPDLVYPDGPYANAEELLADINGVSSDVHDDKGGDKMPPEPTPGFYLFLENCGKTLDIGCTDDIFISLFNRTDINRYCCGEIMEMGKQCHDGFVSTLARIDKYKEFWSVLPKRGEWLWNYCQKIGGEKRKNEPSRPVRNGGRNGKPPLPGKDGKKSP